MENKELEKQLQQSLDLHKETFSSVKTLEGLIGLILDQNKTMSERLVSIENSVKHLEIEIQQKVDKADFSEKFAANAVDSTVLKQQLEQNKDQLNSVIEKYKELEREVRVNSEARIRIYAIAAVIGFLSSYIQKYIGG